MTAGGTQRTARALPHRPPLALRLRQSLIVARAAGAGRVLVTCDQDNAGSRTAIESCGGCWDSVAALEGEPPALRFWID